MKDVKVGDLFKDKYYDTTWLVISPNKCVTLTHNGNIDREHTEYALTSSTEMHYHHIYLGNVGEMCLKTYKLKESK